MVIKSGVTHIWVFPFVGMILVCFFSSCASGPLTEQDRYGRTAGLWECDPLADEALENGDYKTSIERHMLLLAKEPENGLAMYHLGYIYGRTGDHLSEIRYYEKAVDNGFVDNDQLIFNLGMAYSETGQFEKAVKSFNSALAVNPDNADILVQLGVVYRETGDNRMAEKKFMEAEIMDTDSLEARFGLSFIYIEEGRFEEAVLELNKILEIEPDNQDAWQLLNRIENAE